MHNVSNCLVAFAVSAVMLCPASRVASAEGPFQLIRRLAGHGPDQSTCDECDYAHDADEECIVRYPVEDCVVGKKKVYDCKIKYEYVAIPETRYRWKKKLITKEVPCPYCHPVCRTENGQQCFAEEKWEKLPLECESGTLHCRHMETKIENVPLKCCETGQCCDHEPGETTVRVKYWSCVKVPYTVYRQVKKPVCVKQPRCEKVEVPITRYKCEDVDECDVCPNCNGAGCAECGQ